PPNPLPAGERESCSGQFRDQLVIFGLGPGPRGAGAHVAERANLHAELGDVVAARRLHDADQVKLAIGQVGLLDFDTELFGRLARGGGTLGRIFDVANSLFGPVHHDNECRHDRLLPLDSGKRDKASARARFIELKSLEFQCHCQSMIRKSGTRFSEKIMLRKELYRGASTITTWRPSNRGSCSILAILAVSSLTRSSSL